MNPDLKPSVTFERRRRFSSNVTWGLGDQGFAFIIGFVSLAVMARLIPSTEIGLLGLATSLLAFATLFDLAPGSIFLRDQLFGRALNLRVTALYGYAILRLFGYIVLGFLASLILAHDPSKHLTLIVIMHAAVLGVFGLKSVAVELTFSQYKQSKITKVQFVSRALQLCLYALLIPFPTIIMYLTISLVVALVEAFFWAAITFSSSVRLTGSARELTREFRFVLVDFAVWSHIAAKSLFILYWLDLYLLQYFLSDSDLGDYTLALRIANFLWLIPAIIRKNLILVFARAKSRRSRIRYFSFLMKIHGMVSILVLVAALLTIPVYLRGVVHVQSDRSDVIIGFFIPLAIAMTIRNFAMPFDSVIFKRNALKMFALVSVIPTLILGIVILTASTYIWGAIGTAWANIVVYGIYSILTIYTVVRMKLISLSVFSITNEDRKYVENTVRGAIAKLTGN